MPATRPEPSVIRGAHVSSLHALAAELGELHREMLRTGHDDVRPVRLALLTLVAACVDEESAAVAEEVVGRLAANHPARAIVVVADRHGSPPGIDADVALECSAAGGADQICAETVRLSVRGEPALHLVSVVMPLLQPDVPVHLWLVGAPPLDQALHGEVLAVCQRIVLDSDAYADPPQTLHSLVAAQREHGHLPVGDLAWTRCEPWRELLAQSFDGVDMLPFLRGARRLEVESCGSRPSAEAWLLAGWLASRLRWPHHGGPELRVTTRADSGVARGGLLAVRLDCALEDRHAEVELLRDGGVITTRMATGEGLSAARGVRAQDAELFALVGAQLQEAGEDRIYTEALRRAAALAEAARR